MEDEKENKLESGLYIKEYLEKKKKGYISGVREYNSIIKSLSFY